MPVTSLFIFVGYNVLISFDSANFSKLKQLFEPKCKELHFVGQEKSFQLQGTFIGKFALTFSGVIGKHASLHPLLGQHSQLSL